MLWWYRFPKTLQSWPFHGFRVFLATGSSFRVMLKFLQCLAPRGLSIGPSSFHPFQSEVTAWL